MAGNVVPSFRSLRRFMVFGRLLGSVAWGLSRLTVVLARLQKLGEKFDSLVLRFLSAVGRYALGRELSEDEKAKLAFFLHKVVLLSFISGYLIGYLVSH